MVGKIVLWCALAIVLLVAAPLGYVTYYIFSPHLLLNETTRALYQYRTVGRRQGNVSMIPGFFLGGETKSYVERMLLSAGLEQWRNSGDPPDGVASRQRFLFRAGAQNIACGNELFLEIDYDGADQLTSATISQGGACL